MDKLSTPRDRLYGFDFAGHNAEVREVWAAFHARAPRRVPVIFGTNARYFLANSDANREGMDFRTYAEDPDAMFDTQLRYQRWCRFNLLQDAELGPPERWTVTVDFQNYYEAGWFGCPVEYFDGQVPDTRPAFADAPERAMEAGLPDPDGGLLGKGLAYYEHFLARAQRETYFDRPIDVAPPACGVGTDGVMTVACSLFGPEFVCTAMAAESARLERLFAFITEGTVRRMTTWRRRLGVPVPQDGFGFADDSIALISTAMYREHVLPHHRRLCDALGTEVPRSVHLCGDATRHFRLMRDELNVWTFDTGFPVDFAALRRELGPDVQLNGGPHAGFLRRASPDAVREAVRRILRSGVLAGGRFLLREGNNLAPHTPLDHTEALYRAGREFGQFQREDAPQRR